MESLGVMPRDFFLSSIEQFYIIRLQKGDSFAAYVF